MDQTLNRDEAQELMGLLGLNMSFWGNLPATRRAYLAKAKQLHPDKGGNVIEMQRLNELYLKLEETVKTVHSNSQREAWTWNFSQVVPTCFTSVSEAVAFNPFKSSLYDAYSHGFHNKMISNWDTCKDGCIDCYCIHCVLIRRHKKRMVYRMRPLVWIDCYCWHCYICWFGSEPTYGEWLFYKMILAQTPYDVLRP
uniref:Small t antigen n=1 Tax=sonrod polyomavirus 1 TaxID=3040504 RepID=A0AA49FIL8_9POLY|nr:small T antigen [sonrod polyomavirus 1]WIL01358.1 small T antigen [sonrod polyomavirus 1]